MEFRFNLNEIFKQPIVEVNQSLIPPQFSGDRRALWDTVSKVAEVVNAMGEASAAAQGLTKPITTADRLRNSEHKIYLLIDQAARNGKGAVTGMLKTGKKGLYVFDRDGHHYQVQPPCVLDFYVHESRQRNGLGKTLFEHMLKKETIEPVKMAIDRPSDKLLGFLNKHYGLHTPVKQMNNYVVFDGFFPEKLDAGQPAEIENNNSSTPLKSKQSANGLQANFSSPYGRYGAPRPPCSMGQIIHNQSSVIQQPQEPSGTSLNIRSPPTSARQRPTPPPSQLQEKDIQSTPNIKQQSQLKVVETDDMYLQEYPPQGPPQSKNYYKQPPQREPMQRPPSIYNPAVPNNNYMPQATHPHQNVHHTQSQPQNYAYHQFNQHNQQMHAQHMSPSQAQMHQHYQHMQPNANSSLYPSQHHYQGSHVPAHNAPTGVNQVQNQDYQYQQHNQHYNPQNVYASHPSGTQINQQYMQQQNTQSQYVTPQYINPANQTLQDHSNMPPQPNITTMPTQVQSPNVEDIHYAQHMKEQTDDVAQQIQPNMYTVTMQQNIPSNQQQDQQNNVNVQEKAQMYQNAHMQNQHLQQNAQMPQNTQVLQNQQMQQNNQMYQNPQLSQAQKQHQGEILQTEQLQQNAQVPQNIQVLQSPILNQNEVQNSQMQPNALIQPSEKIYHQTPQGSQVQPNLQLQQNTLIRNEPTQPNMHQREEAHQISIQQNRTLQPMDSQQNAQVRTPEQNIPMQQYNATAQNMQAPYSTHVQNTPGVNYQNVDVNQVPFLQTNAQPISGAQHQTTAQPQMMYNMQYYQNILPSQSNTTTNNAQIIQGQTAQHRLAQNQITAEQIRATQYQQYQQYLQTQQAAQQHAEPNQEIQPSQNAQNLQPPQPSASRVQLQHTETVKATPDKQQNNNARDMETAPNITTSQGNHLNRQPTMYHYYDGSAHRMRSAQNTEPTHSRQSVNRYNANACGDVQHAIKPIETSNQSAYQGVGSNVEAAKTMAQSTPSRIYTGGSQHEHEDQVNPSPQKLERPRSLSLQQNEEFIEIDENSVKDVESEVLAQNDEIDNLEDEMKDLEINKNQSINEQLVSQVEDKSLESSKKTPSHLTEQGFFDLKFYHNKLW